MAEVAFAYVLESAFFSKVSTAFGGSFDMEVSSFSVALRVFEVDGVCPLANFIRGQVGAPFVAFCG